MTHKHFNAIVFRRCFLTSPGILYLKNTSVKKCQAEYLADTNQVGGNTHWQPATFDNPAKGEQEKVPFTFPSSRKVDFLAGQ